MTVDELVKMGEAMSAYCNNGEVHDVRVVVTSTAEALARDAKKVKGGPASRSCSARTARRSSHG